MYKTLLIGDNPIYRSVLKSALLNRFDGLEVKDCSSDFELLNYVQAYYPDVIVMNINLKGYSTGLDLMRLIKSTCPDIQVVLHSHIDDCVYRIAADHDGADFFLSSDTEIIRLYRFIDSALNNTTMLSSQSLKIVKSVR